MLPAASETNVLVIAIVAVGVEPAWNHSVFLLGCFFSQLVLGIKGKQQKEANLLFLP